MVQNKVKIPIFIYLDIMLKGLGSENLTKVIMEVLTIGEGLPRYQIAQKFIFLGQMVLMSYRAQKMVLQNIFMTLMSLIYWVHCMVHHINLVVQTLPRLPLVP